jgi:AcrR family transcriptional regulator
VNQPANPDPSTRERLIQATLAILDEHGAEKVKVTEVASHADTTTGSLYWFFKNRQHLINTALAERYVAHMRSVVDGIAAVAESVDQPISVLASTTFDLTEPARVAARRQQIRVLADALDDPDLAREIAPVQKDFLQAATLLIEKAQAAGQVSKEFDAYSLALFSQSVTIGLAVADLSPDLMPDTTKWWQLTKRFLEGLQT